MTWDFWLGAWSGATFVLVFMLFGVVARSHHHREMERSKRIAENHRRAVMERMQTSLYFAPDDAELVRPHFEPQNGRKLHLVKQ